MTQTQTTSLPNLKLKPIPESIVANFHTSDGFDLTLRAAKLLASSTMIPERYRFLNKKGIEQPFAIPNCAIVLNMSQRMKADVLMIAQNLHVIEGTPSWSSQYVIACINACGKFSPLRFKFEKLGKKDVTYTESKYNEATRRYDKTEKSISIEDVRCIAWVTEKSTGEKIDSPEVSMEMAIKENWYQKAGSKWQTMPEVMLMYRSASFFGKLYVPELLMGLQTVEEVQDFTDYTQDDGGVFQMNSEDIKPTEPTERPVPEVTTEPKEPELSQPEPLLAPRSRSTKTTKPEMKSPAQILIDCPNGGKVDELECPNCNSHPGCPNF